MIETKVVPYLDPHQLARHQKLWKINRNQIVPARWLEIWEWAREQRDVAANLDFRCVYSPLFFGSPIMPEGSCS